MTPKKKILFVVTEDWYFCSHRLPLATASLKAGYDVVVATRLAKHLQTIEETGARTVHLNYMKRSSLNVFREMATFIELLAIFHKERPDLIHLVALKPALYGSLAAKLAGIPSRVNALGGLGFIFSSSRFLARLLRPILLILFRYLFNDPGSRLILQNQDDLALVTERAGVDARGVRLIRGAGVNMDKFFLKDPPSEIPIVMLASRMLWDKGVAEFVDAARALHEDGMQARFVLVGEPDDENPTSVPRVRLQEWDQSGVVEWWGYQEDMPAILTQACIVCLPSYYGEGVPKVLIEAMACGRPIVTTDMPGCRDLVKNGENGLLVRPRDAEDLANSLALLISNQRLCRRMGEIGRRIAENEYDLSLVISQTLSVYRELTG